MVKDKQEKDNYVQTANVYNPIPHKPWGLVDYVAAGQFLIGGALALFTLGVFVRAAVQVIGG